MTFLALRRRAWCVPLALSLWAAGSAPAVGAGSAPSPVASSDSASPDAPIGPLPVGVLHGFTPPAPSVATSDWRMVNAGVSNMSGMSGAAHDMANHGGPAHTKAPPGHNGGHAGHSAPTPPASERTSPTPMDRAAIGHTAPTAPAAGPHAGHSTHRGAQ
ncbi:hypothetical protein [Pandoraea faecigallinarum]|uniref:hypothetical protein n=1 Tax=Pandoraea faecigallinarum TaxID=656179 RepID=UPI000AB470F0|nr:hypothetical protein [Pandoraea faecigallinarum]